MKVGGRDSERATNWEEEVGCVNSSSVKIVLLAKR